MAANFVQITNVRLMDAGMSNWINCYFSQKQTTPERLRNFRLHIFHHHYYY